MGLYKNWFFLKGIKSKINILFIISLFIFSVFTWIRKKKLITLICISLLIKSIFVLVFSAQYRFFIDVFFVIFYVIFYEYWNKRRSVAVFSILSIFLISLLSFPALIQQYIPSFQLGNFMAGFKKNSFTSHPFMNIISTANLILRFKVQRFQKLSL